MIVRQVGGLGGKLVDVRSLENRIACMAEIAVALIVSDDENNVRAFGSRKGERQKQGAEQEFHGESGMSYLSR